MPEQSRMFARIRYESPFRALDMEEWHDVLTAVDSDITEDMTYDDVHALALGAYAE